MSDADQIEFNKKFREINGNVCDQSFDDEKEISDICGNPKNSKQSLCIQGCHMRLESVEAIVINIFVNFKKLE